MPAWALQLHMIPKDVSMLISEPQTYSVRHIYHVLAAGLACEAPSHAIPSHASYSMLPRLEWLVVA